jgi:hypothetical protein
MSDHVKSELSRELSRDLASLSHDNSRRCRRRTCDFHSAIFIGSRHRQLIMTNRSLV